jgi:DNA-binding transcriptional MerR regulator
MSKSSFQAGEIESLLGIGKNKLFYWTRTYRLLTPEIAEAQGTGNRARYSFRNLVELKFIAEMVKFGMDLRRIQAIKDFLDKPHPELDNLSVFEHVLRADFKEKYSISIKWPSKTRFTVMMNLIHGQGDVDIDEAGPRVVPGPVEFVLADNTPENQMKNKEEDPYSGVQIELGRLVIDLWAKLGEG